MRAVVMAGGIGSRWGNHRGVPKHLVDIDGEPLLVRTVRQLRDRDVADVVVLAPPDRRYDVPGGWVARPTFAGCDTDKFLSTVEWWTVDSPTVIVYGDVYLSDAAADALCAAAAPMAWVGRSGPSSWTGCPWGELFGVTVTPPGHGLLAAAIIGVRGLLLASLIPRGGGWEVYRHTQGLPLDPDSDRIDADFVEIDDWSDDFDYPEDYERWIDRRARCAAA